MRVKRRLEKSSNIYVDGNDDEQITISKLNDMLKEKVSGMSYFVFAIYYEGSCLSFICLYSSELA